MEFADFEVERATFALHRQTLLRDHDGEYVVIVATRVIAIVPTLEEALDAGFAQGVGARFFVERIAEPVPIVVPFAFQRAI